MKLTLPLAFVLAAQTAFSAPLDQSEDDNVDPLEFKNYEIGDSRHSQSIEVNFGGGLANSIFYPSIAWNKIFWGGAGEIHIPFVYWVAHTEPTSESGAEFADPSHTLIGSGLQIRYFKNNVDQGLFWGGGIKINYWDISYNRIKQNQLDPKVPTSETSWNIIPLVETGYLYPIEQVRDLYAQASGEIGWNLVQDSYEEQETRGELPFSKTSFYWTIQAGLSYAF